MYKIPFAAPRLLFFIYFMTPSSSSGLPPFPYARGFYTFHRYRDNAWSQIDLNHQVYEKKIHQDPQLFCKQRIKVLAGIAVQNVAAPVKRLF